MEIYQIGPDCPYDLAQDEAFEWVVHWYEDGDYDGHGEAVGLCKEDGLLYVKNLGHCSCYGPMDGGLGSGDKMTVEDFLSEKDDIISYDARKEIKEKVRELVALKAKVFSEPFNFLD